MITEEPWVPVHDGHALNELLRAAKRALHKAEVEGLGSRAEFEALRNAAEWMDDLRHQACEEMGWDEAKVSFSFTLNGSGYSFGR